MTLPDFSRSTARRAHRVLALRRHLLFDLAAGRISLGIELCLETRAAPLGTVYAQMS